MNVLLGAGCAQRKSQARIGAVLAHGAVVTGAIGRGAGQRISRSASFICVNARSCVDASPK